MEEIEKRRLAPDGEAALPLAVTEARQRMIPHILKALKSLMHRLMGYGNYPEDSLMTAGMVHKALQHAQSFIALSKRLAFTMKVTGQSFGRFDDALTNPVIKMCTKIFLGTRDHPGIAGDYKLFGMDFTHGIQGRECGFARYAKVIMLSDIDGQMPMAHTIMDWKGPAYGEPRYITWADAVAKLNVKHILIQYFPMTAL